MVMFFVREVFSPWDHAALRVDGIVFGIYPTSAPMGAAYSKANISIESLSSFKRKYNMPKIYFLTINLNLNVEQENKLKNYFYSLRKQNSTPNNNFYYSLFGNQCATTINDALNTISLKNEIFDNSTFKTPKQLFESLRTKGIQNGSYFPEDYQ